MTKKMDVKITLEEFAIDTHFDKEVDELLNKLTMETQNKIKYETLKLYNNIEFDLVSDTIYLQGNFINQFEQLIKNKDKQTQIFLDKNIKLKYKLETSQTLPRSGSWQDFKRYISQIQFL